MKNTNTHKSKHSNEIYQIKKTFSCNSKMVVYLIQGRICGKQDNGSIVTKFRTRANSHKSTYRNFRKRQKVSKEAHDYKRFHEGYLPSDHNGIFDWSITVIDQAETQKRSRKLKKKGKRSYTCTIN